MKKLIAIALTLAMVFALAACGGSASTTPSSTSAGQSDSVSKEKNTKVDYPTKPITLYCGFSAGGSSDLLCRILAESMTEKIGQPVTVVNKNGGGGWVCWSEVIKTVEPDGYTFSLINSPNVTMGKYDTANPREYDHNDFDLLGNHVSDYNVVACRKDETRFNDMASFIEYAKNNTLIVGSSAAGIMSDDGTIVERMNKELGTKIEIVTTKGAKDNETYLLNKSTDILVGNVSDVLTGKKNGDFTVMCVFAPERVSLMDDVPTCKELGFGEIYGNSSRGYALPKGVDPAVREILYNAIVESINDPKTISALEAIGAATEFVPQEEYAKFLDDGVNAAKAVYGVN
ncbi:tripartite tricarboxylate transporter substrate-binding protein [Oscillospiraceae bacterium LTW-04]|nr:tripartite tricarboxylate transporter substrate binding protein [Oscillospiraceae bacterium MB24-C1]